MPLCPGLSPRLPGKCRMSRNMEGGGRESTRHTGLAPSISQQVRAGSSCLPRHPEDPAPGPPPQSACTPTPTPGTLKDPAGPKPCPSSTPSVAWGLQTRLNKQWGVKPAIWNSLPGSGRTASRASRGGAGGRPAHGRMVCAQEAAGEGKGWASPRDPTSAGHARQLPWGLGPCRGQS